MIRYVARRILAVGLFILSLCGCVEEPSSVGSVLLVSDEIVTIPYGSEKGTFVVSNIGDGDLRATISSDVFDVSPEKLLLRPDKRATVTITAVTRAEGTIWVSSEQGDIGKIRVLALDRNDSTIDEFYGLLNDLSLIYSPLAHEAWLFSATAGDNWALRLRWIEESDGSALVKANAGVFTVTLPNDGRGALLKVEFALEEAWNRAELNLPETMDDLIPEQLGEGERFSVVHRAFRFDDRLFIDGVRFSPMVEKRVIDVRRSASIDVRAR